MVNVLSVPGRFNRINSGRSIPTTVVFYLHLGDLLVSIVSIQADQSRRVCDGLKILGDINVSIVSIQADQSRP